MNFVVSCLTKFYFRLLRLYPGSFRDEFASEMQVVFRDSITEAAGEGIPALLFVCLRELGGLPSNIFREFWHEVQRKEMKMIASESIDPTPDAIRQTNPREAMLGVLPFILFGIVSMLARFDLLFHGEYSYLNDAYLYLAFHVLALVGLFFGLIKGVPSWTYSFLGWLLTIVWMSYWHLSVVTGFELAPFSWQTWIPLLVTFAIALIWRRSLTPLIQLFKGIWQDWTLLSLTMYTFVGWMMLGYEENYSPYLIAFMMASILVIAASVWAFMRNTKTLYRFTALLGGFVAGLIIIRISESTWDIAAYYGFPVQPPTPWYDSILDVIVMTGFWGVILLLPALMGFVRSVLKNDKAV